jgi:glutamine cyclotransferase
VTEGSERVIVINSQTLEYEREFKVKNSNGDPIGNINDLQFVNGYIWANVFQANWIIRIDPKSGIFNKAVDLTEFANT